jgi:hypothetical protein
MSEAIHGGQGQQLSDTKDEGDIAGKDNRSTTSERARWQRKLI